MKKVSVVIEKTGTGYSAYAEDIENAAVATTGNTLEELKSNILEVLNLYLEHVGKSEITEKDLTFTLDLPSFFEFYDVINVKALADDIPMNRSLLVQYIKGIKKPSPAQTNKILKGVQKVGRELASINLI